MARRPIYIARISRSTFVQEIVVDFVWFPGLSFSQKQKSIASLHKSARSSIGLTRILEISSKSPVDLGVQLSAFNLLLPLESREVSVEAAFQAAKMFERAGPFSDLLNCSSRDAKRDPRLKTSGRLNGFSLLGDEWPLSPPTAFYDWLYMRALVVNPMIAEQLSDFEAFTDIEFNPEKSLNCQARSAALYVSLRREGLLERALADKQSYLDTLAGLHASP